MTYHKIDYVKADPSGNTTIFVLSPLPRERYGPIAAQIMEERVLCAEQVGFLERTDAGSRMHMMGGEFCANASRSYAAWSVMAGAGVFGKDALRPLPKGAKTHIEVEVSGSKGPLGADIEDMGCAFGCFAEIDMPAPAALLHGHDGALGDYSLVAFEGIIHGVLWDKGADQALMPELRRLIRAQGLPDACYGAMFVEGTAPLTIRPLVYVKAAGSTVWESSCGSGSLAALCALADRTGQSYHRYAVKQPGGALEISARYGSGGITGTRLAGPVYFTASGTAHVHV